MSKDSNLPALSPAGGEAGLNRYLAEIRKFPLLTAEQEYMLAKRYSEHGDPEAAKQMVTSHLRLVAKIAMGYRGYGLPVSELIAEGNTNQDIAELLCLSRKTVETHRSNIMDKLDLHKVTDLVKYAIREGLVGLD